MAKKVVVKSRTAVSPGPAAPAATPAAAAPRPPAVVARPLAPAAALARPALAPPRDTPRSSGRAAIRPPPQLEMLEEGEEHRQFPRALMQVRFSLWIGEEDDRRFTATLRSINLSVSGAFLESSFFLPVGTELRVSFELEEGGDPVQARALIVREERADPRTGAGRSGLAIRFVEFFGQTEVTLAKLFLGQQLLGFAQEYLQSKRARSLPSELDRVVDALAAWELLKVTTPGDPWRPNEKGQPEKD